MWQVADWGEQGRSEVQAAAEIEAGWFERQLDGLGPEVQLIASAMAALAVEDVLADVDTEAGARHRSSPRRHAERNPSAEPFGSICYFFSAGPP